MKPPTAVITKNKFLAVLTVLLWHGLTWNSEAASCCGGAASLPSLITGDDAAQWSLNVRADNDLGVVDTDGNIARTTDYSESGQTLNLQGAFRFEDLWQTGIAIPLVRRNYSATGVSESGVGLGDIRMHLGYEFLPERTYSKFIPHGLAYFALTIPTGTSFFTSQSEFSTDVTGRGFTVPAVGVALLKDWGGVDALVSVEGRAYLPKTFESEGASRSFGQGWGWGASFGAGVSPLKGPFRIGAQIAYSFEGPRTVTTNDSSETSSVSRWSIALQGSYRFTDTWSLSLVYDDPLALGGSRNTVLTRSFSVLIQQRFPL